MSRPQNNGANSAQNGKEKETSSYPLLFDNPIQQTTNTILLHGMRHQSANVVYSLVAIIAQDSQRDKEDVEGHLAARLPFRKGNLPGTTAQNTHIVTVMKIYRDKPLTHEVLVNHAMSCATSKTDVLSDAISTKDGILKTLQQYLQNLSGGAVALQNLQQTLAEVRNYLLLACSIPAAVAICGAIPKPNMAVTIRTAMEVLMNLVPTELGDRFMAVFEEKLVVLAVSYVNLPMPTKVDARVASMMSNMKLPVDGLLAQRVSDDMVEPLLRDQDINEVALRAEEKLSTGTKQGPVAYSNKSSHLFSLFASAPAQVARERVQTRSTTRENDEEEEGPTTVTTSTQTDIEEPTQYPTSRMYLKYLREQPEKRMLFTRLNEGVVKNGAAGVDEFCLNGPSMVEWVLGAYNATVNEFAARALTQDYWPLTPKSFLGRGTAPALAAPPPSLSATMSTPATSGLSMVSHTSTCLTLSVSTTMPAENASHEDTESSLTTPSTRKKKKKKWYPPSTAARRGKQITTPTTPREPVGGGAATPSDGDSLHSDELRTVCTHVGSTGKEPICDERPAPKGRGSKPAARGARAGGSLRSRGRTSWRGVEEDAGDASRREPRNGGKAGKPTKNQARGVAKKHGKEPPRALNMSGVDARKSRKRGLKRRVSLRKPLKFLIDSGSELNVLSSDDLRRLPPVPEGTTGTRL